MPPGIGDNVKAPLPEESDKDGTNSTVKVNPVRTTLVIDGIEIEITATVLPVKKDN